jgi:hypothetical protein
LGVAASCKNLYRAFSDSLNFPDILITELSLNASQALRKRSLSHSRSFLVRSIASTFHFAFENSEAARRVDAYQIHHLFRGRTNLAVSVGRMEWKTLLRSQYGTTRMSLKSHHCFDP